MILVISSFVNFGVVVLILWWFGRKPVAQMFASRRTVIESSILDAESKFTTAEKDLIHWQSKWDTRESEVRGLVDDAKKIVANYRKKALEAGQAEADRIRKESLLLKKGETMKAKQSLQNELVEQSIKMAELFFQEKMNEQDRQKLVTDYVEMVNHGTAR